MIHKVNKSKIINKKNPKFKSDRINNILPYLPNEDLFFDSRHLNYGFTNDILPFSLTARIDNGQQYLKIMDKNTININEPKVQQVGNLLEDKNFKNPQVGRIYGTDGLSPTLNTMQGGGREPKIVEPIIYDDYNSKIANDQDCIGTITTQTGNSAPRHSYKIIEPTIIDDTYKNRDARLYNEVSPTLRSEREGLKVIEPNDFKDTEDYIESLPRKEFYGTDADAKAKEYLNNLSKKEQNIEFKGKMMKDGDGLYTDVTERFNRGALDGISRALKAEMHDAGVVDNYRIRKLTPRECFRLQGVDDTDIDKIQSAGISNSQQYKLAGNSIVVDVLYHIFRKMFIDKENENDQLSLF